MKVSSTTALHKNWIQLKPSFAMTIFPPAFFKRNLERKIALRSSSQEAGVPISMSLLKQTTIQSRQFLFCSTFLSIILKVLPDFPQSTGVTAPEAVLGKVRLALNAEARSRKEKATRPKNNKTGTKDKLKPQPTNTANYRSHQPKLNPKPPKKNSPQRDPNTTEPRDKLRAVLKAKKIIKVQPSDQWPRQGLRFLPRRLHQTQTRHFRHNPANSFKDSLFFSSSGCDLSTRSLRRQEQKGLWERSASSVWKDDLPLTSETRYLPRDDHPNNRADPRTKPAHTKPTTTT